jgi:hypothetical protein
MAKSPPSRFMAYAEIKQESMERDIHHRESNSGEQ